MGRTTGLNFLWMHETTGGSSYLLKYLSTARVISGGKRVFPQAATSCRGKQPRFPSLHKGFTCIHSSPFGFHFKPAASHPLFCQGDGFYPQHGFNCPYRTQPLNDINQFQSNLRFLSGQRAIAHRQSSQCQRSKFSDCISG